MKALIVAALIISSSATFAQTSAPADKPSTDAAPTKVKTPKPICRSEETTGSMFPTRTCHSKQGWTAIDAANAANAERLRNSHGTAGRS
jgi:hypothetical protein